MFLVLVGLSEVRDGMPQLAGTAPLRAGTRVRAFIFRIYIFYWLSEALFRYLDVFTGYILMYISFQENELLRDH